MNRLLRTCRTLHSWLGIFVMPWVFVIGATGLYLNHSDAVWSIIGGQEFAETEFEEQKSSIPATLDSAIALSERFWPDEPISDTREEEYHGRPSIFVEKDAGVTIVSIPTGHYYTKTDYTRRTFSPEGELLHTKIYWHSVFKDLHETGWLGGLAGSWPADVVAVAMMVFAVTGSVLWTAPRLRRRRRPSRIVLPGASRLAGDAQAHRMRRA